MSSIIPFDKRDGFIWYNGELVEWPNATTHILNHGLHYGSCVFEGIAVYNNKIFKLKEHSQRLIDSAKLLDFDIPYSLEELMSATSEIVQVQKVDNGYIRPFAWRGSEQMAISAKDNSTNVAIATWKWPPYFSAEAKLNGIDMVFAKYSRPSPETAPTASKAAGLYMICTYSKHTAERKGYTEAIMLDYRGYIAEATCANMFFIINDELHTPIADCFLNGITRQTVISLAKENGIKVVERHIKPTELEYVQDAFLTGTAAEITRVNSITDEKSDKKYNFSKHPITLKLSDLYYQEIEK
ncbi:MAG: branched-chain amino acid aminotransferase [Rickettsiales bacterium]|jgi:branched-chain amino acid aminotransferase|nr:branched-chain amino acid aminotransferase [Rickettsiales bacterium]